MRFFFVITTHLILLFGTLLAKPRDISHTSSAKEGEQPWFIGTFLSTGGENIELGKFLVKPIVLVTNIYGDYDKNSRLIHDQNAYLFTSELFFETGMTKTTDISLTLTEIYSHTSGGDSSNFSDAFVQIGFQISKDMKGRWIPDLRVILAESFPTGKYQNLNPQLHFNDATGSGAFETSLTFVTEKIFYNIPKHPYSWNYNFTVIHHSNVAVKGTSIYGGGPLTKGFVIQGERFISNLAYEFKFNNNWGWGIDIHYQYRNSSSFHNKGGGDIFEGVPSFDQFSLAPEIEYNFNQDFALSLVLWYTLFGRNNLAFLMGAFYLSYEF